LKRGDKKTFSFLTGEKKEPPSKSFDRKRGGEKFIVSEERSRRLFFISISARGRGKSPFKENPVRGRKGKKRRFITFPLGGKSHQSASTISARKDFPSSKGGGGRKKMGSAVATPMRKKKKKKGNWLSTVCPLRRKEKTALKEGREEGDDLPAFKKRKSASRTVLGEEGKKQKKRELPLFLSWLSSNRRGGEERKKKIAGKGERDGRTSQIFLSLP